MLHANNDSEGQLELWVDKFYITSTPPPKKKLNISDQMAKTESIFIRFFFINPINWLIMQVMKRYSTFHRGLSMKPWVIAWSLLQGACVQPLNWQYINTIDGWLHLLRLFKGLDCNFLALIAIKTATECLCLYMYEKISEINYPTRLLCHWRITGIQFYFNHKCRHRWHITAQKFDKPSSNELRNHCFLHVLIQDLRFVPFVQCTCLIGGML